MSNKEQVRRIQSDYGPSDATDSLDDIKAYLILKKHTAHFDGEFLVEHRCEMAIKAVDRLVADINFISVEHG